MLPDYVICFKTVTIHYKAVNVIYQFDFFILNDKISDIDFIKQYSDEPFVIDSEGIAKLREFFPEEWAKIESEFTLVGKATHKLYTTEERTSDILLYLPETE